MDPLDKSERCFSPSELGSMFSQKNVNLWLNATFVYNHFVNLFLITESLFAFCPSDNFINQEEFLTLLIELKLSDSAKKKLLSPPISGQQISIKEYVGHACLSEFYCLHLLIAMRPDMRRKMRFIRITDCFSVTTEIVMKKLFDVAYLGGEHTSSIISSNEVCFIDNIRTEFVKLSSEYGAKYKKNIELNFDGIKVDEFNLYQTIHLSTANFLNEHKERISLSFRNELPLNSFDSRLSENIMASLAATAAYHHKSKYYKCSGLAYRMLRGMDFCGSTAVSNRVMLFFFHWGDVELWINGSYFSEYFATRYRFDVENLHLKDYLINGALNVSLYDVCQPVAPVDVESEFYSLIFSHIITQQIQKSCNALMDSNKNNVILFSVACDEQIQFWVQSLAFLRNVRLLFESIGAMCSNTVFCNSNGSLNGFDVVLSFPGSESQPSNSNFSYIDCETLVPGGDILLVNPFGSDIYFRAMRYPGKILILRRNSFMLVRGSLELSLCANKTCETWMYFTTFIVPRKTAIKINVKKANSAESKSARHTTIIKSIATQTVFEAPICSYRCTTGLCNKLDNYYHYPYCDHCLNVCLKLERRYVSDTKGCGLFTNIALESDILLLCELVSNDFYELLTHKDIVSRYGTFDVCHLPYVTEIPFPDGLPSLFLDQTVKRGIFSLINVSNGVSLVGNNKSVSACNCKVEFDISDTQIVLKLITIRSISADEELCYFEEKEEAQSDILSVDYRRFRL